MIFTQKNSFLEQEKAEILYTHQIGFLTTPFHVNNNNNQNQPRNFFKKSPKINGKNIKYKSFLGGFFNTGKSILALQFTSYKTHTILKKKNYNTITIKRHKSREIPNPRLKVCYLLSRLA